MPTGSVCTVWRWISGTPDAVPRARAALRCALDQLGYDDEVIDDTVLAASELVANATEYAPGPYELRLRRTAAELLCEVLDTDPRMPEIPAFPVTAPFEPSPERRGGGLDALVELLSERGRGLHIVDQLTGGTWGFICKEKDGVKVAWLALPLPAYAQCPARVPSSATSRAQSPLGAGPAT
ncbi:ATP-binding protein [Streptomyces sp. T-3]|nr:ATP-binding protein [Streptomyces sp. T-3]